VILQTFEKTMKVDNISILRIVRVIHCILVINVIFINKNVYLYYSMILTSIEKLIPGEKYLVVVNWNSDSNLFIQNEYLMFAKFMRLDFRKRRTRSFDSGLQILLQPSRINAIFEYGSMHHSLSSANLFYKIIKPTSESIASEFIIRKLPLNHDVIGIIRSFL